MLECPTGSRPVIKSKWNINTFFSNIPSSIPYQKTCGDFYIMMGEKDTHG